ncbi:hypothetical protein MTO96_025634 [Rhipicephalus appendiculatus]
MTEQPRDIPANADLGRPLGHSSKPMKSLEKFPAGALHRKKSIADAVSGLSDKVGHPTAPSLPPTDHPPSKARITEEMRMRRLGVVATGPGGLLRHYASRVNDGSWRWHSKTETSTTSTECSSSTHSSSGSGKSRWASRAACLVLCIVLCLVSVALLSFVVFHAIPDTVFNRWRSLGEKLDPLTVQPPVDEIARV